jgi:hypothetical protein
LSASAAKVVFVYTVGFVAAQYWAVWVFRDVLSGIENAPFAGVLTPRYFVISIIEAALATAAFAMGIGFRRRGRLSRPLTAAVLGILAGGVACSLTVGVWPIVPRITEGDAQLLLQAVAGGIISYAFGWAISTFLRERVANDG